MINLEVSSGEGLQAEKNMPLESAILQLFHSHRLIYQESIDGSAYLVVQWPGSVEEVRAKIADYDKIYLATPVEDRPKFTLTYELI